MTDHQRLLVALLDAPPDDPDSSLSAAAVTAVLYALGTEHREWEAVPTAPVSV